MTHHGNATFLASGTAYGGVRTEAVPTRNSGAVAVVWFVGRAMSLILRESDAEYLEEQIDGVHLLLYARAEDPEKEQATLDILSRHGAYDAEINEAPSVERQAFGSPWLWCHWYSR